MILSQKLGSKQILRVAGFLFLGYIFLSIIAPNSVYADYTASITTSGAQSIDVSAGGAGTAIGVDSINVSTTCRAGYNLSIATSVDDNSLYLNGDAANNISGKYFTAVDGTNTLGSSNNINKWGYYYNSNNNTAPTSSNIFSAVPTLGTTASIVTPTAGNTDISDNLNIYYGVSVNIGLEPGTYKMKPDTNNSNNAGTITYYLTMAEACIPYIVQFNPTSMANNTTLTGTGTMNNQEFYKDVAQSLTTNAFTAPTGYEFKEWNTAQDGTGTSYTDAQSVTNLTTPGNTITLYAQWQKIDPCRTNPNLMYCKVASQVKTNSTACTVTVKDANGQDKCSQNATTLQATISAPATGSTPATDTSNSGVFLYNSGKFGDSSDVNDGYDIYYYRGVLDSSFASSTYGSSGDSAYYQNYVRLGDTCWRIVRTTASGGTKMIYNGIWTGSTCANASTNAQVITSAFNNSSASNEYSSLDYRNIHAEGYTYNNAVTSVGSASTNTTIAKVFGSSSDYSVNSSNSIIKQYIEQTWFSNISAYERILEPNAGYCNDRTLYPDGSYALADKLAESTQIVPYGSSGMTVYYFGAYVRNMSAAQTPTLECPRGVVDIYSTTTESGGNGQLSKPVALLTADELSFAGSGRSTASQGSSYHANSYLRSGSDFWLLSPYLRDSNGRARGFDLYSDGHLDRSYVRNSLGVRPAISLKPGTTAASGTGTATDPWVVTAP